MPRDFWTFKVHIFWEGHKILRNLHLLFYVLPVKSKEEISQNFVAFSEYMNFNNQNYQKSKQKLCKFHNFAFLISVVFKILCNLVWIPTLRFKYWIYPNQGASKLGMLKVVACAGSESILPWSLKRMHITRHCITCPNKMCAKHARILSLLEMSAVMLGTAGEVSVPVIQATPDTNVKNLVSSFF